MKKNDRYIWAVAIVIADLLVFALPLAAIFCAYVIVARPAWFKTWLDDLYQGE